MMQQQLIYLELKSWRHLDSLCWLQQKFWSTINLRWNWHLIKITILNFIQLESKCHKESGTMNGFESRKLILKPFVREVLMQIVQYNVQLPISRYKIQIAADGPQTFLQKKRRILRLRTVWIVVLIYLYISGFSPAHVVEKIPRWTSKQS